MLIDLFKKIGKGDEFKLFLNNSTIVIKISGACINDDIGKDISLLNKLGIFPIIVHGAGKQLDLILGEKSGLRITPEDKKEEVKEAVLEISEKLSKSINSSGGNAQIVIDSVKGEKIPGLGLTGKVISINKNKLNLKNTIIIPSLSDDFLNINADSIVNEIVKIIKPKKLIFLTKTGGVLDSKENVIPYINLGDEILEDITGGMAFKIDEIKKLVNDVPDCAVTITSPENMIKEIFTIKGSGTYIKNYSINWEKEFDKSKLKQMLESSFGKSLSKNYFDSGIEDIIVEKDYKGAAIIKKYYGEYYLDKFAVGKESQGTGLGKAMWDKLNKKYDKLIWRSLPENKFNEFYFKNSTGMIKNTHWNVFWKGIADEKAVLLAKEIFVIEKTMV